MLKKPFQIPLLALMGICVTLVFLIVSCASTEIIESPKTAFVSPSAERKAPPTVWSSRTLPQKFDYLAQVKVRSWTYNGGLSRLTDAGKQVGADAIVDVHYEQVGFFSTFTAFAVKYK